MSEQGAKIYYPDFGQNDPEVFRDLPPTDPGLPENPRLWLAHFRLIERAGIIPEVIEFPQYNTRQR